MALACAGVLMIQQGAHSWLTAPHPSVAFSISVRPNGIRSVIIRLFTVHAGLTVNFWDMRPLSSSNLFFSELQRRFISPVLTARMSRPSSNWHTGVFVQVPFHSFLITDNFLPFSGAALNKKVPKGVCTYRHKWSAFDHAFMALTVNCPVSAPKWRWRNFQVPPLSLVHTTELERRVDTWITLYVL